MPASMRRTLALISLLVVTSLRVDRVACRKAIFRPQAGQASRGGLRARARLKWTTPLQNDDLNEGVPEHVGYVPYGSGNDKIPEFVLNFNNPRRKRRVKITPHRYTSKDWVRILQEMPSSVTLSRISGIITAHMLWSLTLATVNQCLVTLPKIGNPSLVTPALGLLLVFRTNAAYNRFWEGRKIWEKLLDKSRCLVRYMALHEDSAGMRRVERVAQLTINLALTLKQHLTSFRDVEMKYVESHLANDTLVWGCQGEMGIRAETELETFKKVTNKPLFIVNKLGECVNSIPTTGVFTSRERLQMLRLVDEMTSHIGACERIVQTPVPLNYARHTSRFLTFWCLTLPLTLVPDLQFFTIPIMALIVWGLFGIQEIGLMIEEPFRTSLPLHAFVDIIHNDVREGLLTTRIARDKGPDPEWISNVAPRREKESLSDTQSSTQFPTKSTADALRSLLGVQAQAIANGTFSYKGVEVDKDA
ncbi:hypothetical protein AAMO2058_001392700 [Amorphochlora amoebiformis]